MVSVAIVLSRPKSKYPIMFTCLVLYSDRALLTTLTFEAHLLTLTPQTYVDTGCIPDAALFPFKLTCALQFLGK